MKLNLGCGNKILEGYINLDINKGKGVDIVHDLNELPLPFENEIFDYILCRDVLEHVNYLPLMDELYRILKIGGKLKIKVPHFTSKITFGDPTHINQFSFITFYYFVDSGEFAYNRNINLFSRINIRIGFEKSNKIFLRFFYKFLENWVNKSYRHQRFYENSFLRIFPAWYINVLLHK